MWSIYRKYTAVAEIPTVAFDMGNMSHLGSQLLLLPILPPAGASCTYTFAASELQSARPAVCCLQRSSFSVVLITWRETKDPVKTDCHLSTVGVDSCPLLTKPACWPWYLWYPPHFFFSHYLAANSCHLVCLTWPCHDSALCLGWLFQLESHPVASLSLTGQVFQEAWLWRPVAFDPLLGILLLCLPCPVRCGA